MILQIGTTAEKRDRLEIILPNVTTKALQLQGLNIKTESDAGAAIALLKDGIDYISEERGRMGAYQNRLEHTMSALHNTAENVQASESRIRDTDMAKEMMQFTKNNILLQAGQSMLM